MTHEIKSALHGIKGLAYYIEQNWDNIIDEDKKKQVLAISRICEKTNLFVDSILNFSKFQYGSATLNVSQVDLIELIKEVIEDCNNFHNLERRIPIDFLHDEVQSAVIPCDHEMLYRVVLNLLHNAIKYSETGHIEVKLLKKNEKGREFFLVSIKDQGIGIPTEELNDVFKPFFRSSNVVKENYQKGTGIGLTLCKQIILSHRGRIWVTNNEGEGATFHFSLPANSLSGALELTKNKSKQSSSSEHNKKFILFVDDDVHCHEVVKMLLHNHREYVILSAYTALEAIHLIDSFPRTDLVMLDITLPDMSGFDLYKSLKKKPSLKDMPIIFQSGVTSYEKEIEKLISKDNVGVLNKPYNKQELIQILKIML
jgi:CheY-like chemotaxis protein/two-component sensor histidine kinase